MEWEEQEKGSEKKLLCYGRDGLLPASAILLPRFFLLLLLLLRRLLLVSSSL